MQHRPLGYSKSTGPRFDPKLWQKLGEAGLVGVAIPEE
jgi:alkylation response protein AidB-like acyl-CoA dehydrogenase